MRYYFAGRYNLHPTMRRYRYELLAAIPGAQVTSRWIDCHGGQFREAFTPQQLAADPAGCWRLGQHDLDDLDQADTVVAFTDLAGGGRGGRHHEFGAAMALGKRLVVVGPRVNVFHTHPAIEQHDSWDTFLDCEVALWGSATAR